jgi:hypothetical protein
MLARFRNIGSFRRIRNIMHFLEKKIANLKRVYYM